MLLNWQVVSPLAIVLLFLVPAAFGQPSWQSEIVYAGADGRLVYEVDAEGNRIPDFSVAGYRGGGVPLPTLPVVHTVGPVVGDNTAHLQSAIDVVAERDPDADGFRGALLLEAGLYELSGTLFVRDGGIVIRGVGDDSDPASSTVLRRTGTSQAPVLYFGRNDLVGGNENLIRRDFGRPPATITTDFVGIGERSFEVDQPQHYAAGDRIVVFHPTTVAWLNAVDFGGTAGAPNWTVGTNPIAFARTIERIEGTTVTLDAALFNPLDRSLSPSYIYPRVTDQLIEEVGLEDLRIVIDTESPSAENHARNAVEFAFVENAWVRGATALHFWHAGFSVQQSRFVTVAESRALEPHSLVTGERRYNFEVYRAQNVLFESNLATNARHAFVGNGQARDSGIVLLNNRSENASTSSEAHRQWGMGFLFDNHTEVGSSGSGVGARRIHLGNRGSYGSSHGWSCAHCVAWNCQMNGSPIVVEKPPTAQNYAIGVQGVVLTNGPFTINTGPYVEGTFNPGLNPSSLYLRQLEDRLHPVSTSPVSDPVAGAVVLHPNYPNPFSGRSRIDFETPVPGEVEVAVFDVLGRRVQVLTQATYPSGRHTVDVSSQDLASGVYLYRVTLNALGETHVQTRRMVVR